MLIELNRESMHRSMPATPIMSELLRPHECRMLPDTQRKEEKMILNFLKLIHCIFGTVSLYAGTVVLLRIFAGQPFERMTVIFLRSALAASVTGLLLPFHVFQPTHLAAMAAVYVSGSAVLAWRRFHLTQVWGLIFALSLIGTLCLDALVAVQHLFHYLSAVDATAPQPARLLSLITESIVALFFTTMGVFAVRRYRNKPNYSMS